MRKFNLPSDGIEYVFPGLAVALIIAGVVLQIFVDGVVWSGWFAIAGGVFMLLFSSLMWCLNDGP